MGGIPPRSGRARCNVDSDGMLWSAKVDDGAVKCLPAYIRRVSLEGGGQSAVGPKVRSDLMVAMLVLGGTLRVVAAKMLDD